MQLSFLMNITDTYTDPEMWADSELKRWLQVVRAFLLNQIETLCMHANIFLAKRGLLPNRKATRDELLERVKANHRPPPRN